MKYHAVEFFDQVTQDTTTYVVGSVFSLAVISPISFPDQKERVTGINVGIQIPLPDEDADKDFSQRFFGEIFKKDGFVLAYILGDNQVKVPIWVHGGNGYNSKYESSVLFGYVTPSLVGPDAPPTPKRK